MAVVKRAHAATAFDWRDADAYRRPMELAGTSRRLMPARRSRWPILEIRCTSTSAAAAGFVAFGFEVDAKARGDARARRLSALVAHESGHALTHGSATMLAGGRMLALAVPSSDRAGRDTTTCSTPRTRHSRS
jgi:hypothetical protein